MESTDALSSPQVEIMLRSTRSSRRIAGRVPSDSMALAPPFFATFLPYQLRIAASEDTLSCLGQRIEQNRGSESLLKCRRDGLGENPEAVLFRDQHETFTNPQHRDGRPLSAFGSLTHVHRMNGAGCGSVLLPESTLQSKHELFQVNPMFVRKPLLAQKVVRIQMIPMMSGAKRNRREVRGLLPHPPGS